MQELDNLSTMGTLLKNPIWTAGMLGVLLTTICILLCYISLGACTRLLAENTIFTTCSASHQVQLAIQATLGLYLLNKIITKFEERQTKEGTFLISVGVVYFVIVFLLWSLL